MVQANLQNDEIALGLMKISNSTVTSVISNLYKTSSVIIFWYLRTIIVRRSAHHSHKHFLHGLN